MGKLIEIALDKIKNKIILLKNLIPTTPYREKEQDYINLN